MHVFFEAQGSRRMKSRAEEVSGVVDLYTKITIRGNYKKGPVPVSVRYGFRFSPDRENYAFDPAEPDDEPWAWTEFSEYETSEDRDTYVSNRYEDLGPNTKMQKIH